jgi:hypothetical protein
MVAGGVVMGARAGRSHHPRRPARRPAPDPTAVADRLLSGCREELSRADGKASMLIGVTVGAMALLWPVGATRPPTESPFGILAMATWGAALVILMGAVFPKLSSRAAAENVTFFGHVARLKDPDLLRRYVTAASRAPLQRTLDQTLDLSRILVVKYRCIRLGICLLGLGAVFSLGIWLV